MKNTVFTANPKVHSMGLLPDGTNLRISAERYLHGTLLSLTDHVVMGVSPDELLLSALDRYSGQPKIFQCSLHTGAIREPACQLGSGAPKAERAVAGVQSRSGWLTLGSWGGSSRFEFLSGPKLCSVSCSAWTANDTRIYAANRLKSMEINLADGVMEENSLPQFKSTIHQWRAAVINPATQQPIFCSEHQGAACFFCPTTGELVETKGRIPIVGNSFLCDGSFLYASYADSEEKFVRAIIPLKGNTPLVKDAELMTCDNPSLWDTGYEIGAWKDGKPLVLRNYRKRPTLQSLEF